MWWTCNCSPAIKKEDWKICTQSFRESQKSNSKLKQLFLLCIILEHTNEKHHNSLRYILMPVSTNYTTLEKRHSTKDISLGTQTWRKHSNGKINHIHNRNLVNIRKSDFHIYYISDSK